MEKLSKLSEYKLTLIYALRDLSRNYKKISSIILTLFISLFILSSIFTIEDSLNKELNNIIRGWDDWVDYRKEIKKKMTPATIKKQVALLEQYSPEDQFLIITQSITNGWTGLFPPKENQNGQNRQNGRGNSRGIETRRASDYLIEGDDVFG